MKTRLCYFVITLIGSLPLTVRRLLAKIIGAVAALVPSREQRVCTLHLRKMLRTSAVSTIKVYQHLVTVLLESFNLKPILNSGDLLDDRQILQYWNGHDRSRGIIALSAHLGNWELLAASAIRNRIPLTVVGREARKSSWQDALERIRKGYGAEILWRSDSAAVKKMIGLLKAGSVIAVLIDQDTDVRSEFSPFFDLPAKTPSALVELGLRCNARFVTALTVRNPDGQYQILIEEIAADNSVQGILDAYNQRLESVIRRYPDQWAWVHKRWRSNIDGTRLSSRDYIKMLEARPVG